MSLDPDKLEPFRLEEGAVVRVNGEQVGVVTHVGVSIDGLPSATVGQPKALFVAGSREQARFWAAEMGYQGRWESSYYGPGSRDFVRPSEREVFFVGAWNTIDVHELHRLWDDIAYLGLHSTFVCSAAGEIIERRGVWLRWTAESSGKPTRFHALEGAAVFDDALDTFGGAADVFRTLCGLQVTRKQVIASPAYDLLERWGSPIGACGVCAHELRRQPQVFADFERALRATAEIAKETAGRLSALARTMPTARYFTDFIR